ncbi:formyltetrahydrofolate deformylase [Fictibacillus gelatini]|uniref:formyltetrahydrofolate deformylase n=1 Tax=Fictibacillus gelatini TaxID=225985 RepID=UPI00040D0640|nr:formyltetrahydrofolate deformylase [Fictibacillus gelatini]
MVGRLLVSCNDRPGIVAAVSQFLSEQGANIVHSDQHTTDPEGGLFFMRIEFQLDGLKNKIETLREQFAEVANEFTMDWRITSADEKKKVAIFVSKEDHCLQDLLWRWRIGEMAADIKMVISNHPDMETIVAPFEIPYYHVPTTKDNREESAVKHLELLEKADVDTIILARYMQIIPKSMIDQYKNQIINIHHSFLPAFVGGKPYNQAYERGVKIIGATAHYVTEELDQGPIIEQDVERVDHRHEIQDLKRVGRDVERMVLARAVQWHLHDKVLVHGNKTVVFR